MILRRLLAVCTMASLFTALTCAAAADQPAPLFDAIDGALPVRLQKLQVTADISGGLAETTVRMEFFNPNSRQLEGQLRFPLAAEQRVTGFALDIDGKLRPAVPVEKARGRQIFEAVERRQVDPALLETTEGNNFRLRVYPVPALGTRTVELRYAEPLARQGSHWSYRLPLAYAGRLQEFTLDVNVHGAAARPQASDPAELQFAKTADGYHARLSRNGYRPPAAMSLQLAASTQPQAFVQEFDGERYFIAEIPFAPGTAPVARAIPKVIGLLWDSSGSGANRQLQAEFMVLDRYFAAIRNVEVRLTRLRDRPEAVVRYKVVDGNWAALRKALEDTVYDGASALAGWTAQADVDAYLLVSDGLLNYGAAAFPALAASQRLDVLNSSLSADTARLAALAEKSGGRMVQVRQDAPGAAVQALLFEPARIASLSAQGATELFTDTSDLGRGVLRVAGRMQEPSVQLKVEVANGAASRTAGLQIASNSPVHPGAAQLWAGYKLHALDADYELKRAEIRRIGQRFNIPTRETSLIVLDTLEDYVRYDVTPPPQYQAAFEQMRALRGARLREARTKRLETVVRDFSQKVAWWEKRYPKDTPLRSVPPEKAGAGGLHVETLSVPGERGAPAPAATPAPAPMPAPMAARAAASERESASRLMADRKAAERQAEARGAEVGIALKKWTPNAPYIGRLKSAGPDTIYAVYLDEKPGYANSSAFFLDAADLLFEKGQRELALRVLSNLAEMDLENRHILRILGYRLLQAGEPALAVPVFEKVLRLAEEEPQSFRDLGLAYAAAGRHQEAIDSLYEVVVRPWDGRFAEIELVVLAELNAIVAAHPDLDVSRIDARLLKNMPLDLRVVLTWDADNSDMDLWVTDPNGERCYFGNRFTYQGGRLSRDFTGGYGPEEFSLREAKPGKYKVEASFFGNRQQVVAGATTLQLTLTSHFGTPQARDQAVTLRLQEKGGTIFVGEFEIKGD